MNWGTQFALRWAAVGAVTWAAYRGRALGRSGVWAALVVGGVVFSAGGWAWAGLLLLFFVSSSLLSHAFAPRKRVLSEKFSKGSRRDWGQVMANGALAALLAASHAWAPESRWVWVAFGGALAAVNADTWATEIGVLSPHLPRHILTGRRVPQGTSGGVSPLGMAAALGGAALIGAATWVGAPTAKAVLAVTVGGWAGAVLDSLLGATVQAMYFCPQCEKETEHTPLHTCGAPTRYLRGWEWMDNDTVNFLASLAGAALAAALWVL